MRICVIGTGFIGGILGRALADAGHSVVFGSRHPEDVELGSTGATASPIEEALASADAVILAIPGHAVAEVSAAHGAALEGKLVVDATNKMRAPVANSRAVLPGGVRYARAFNTTGGENMADPMFGDVRADMFFSAPEADRDTVAKIIDDVGLRPVYVGADKEELVDCLFRLWITLVAEQGRSRRSALRLLEA